MAVELVELVDRLTILVVVHRFPCMGVADSRSLLSGICVRMKVSIRRSFTPIPFRRFWSDARRELLQRLFVVLHGTLGSYPHTPTLCGRFAGGRGWRCSMPSCL
jgi:hypothetical protein